MFAWNEGEFPNLTVYWKGGLGFRFAWKRKNAFLDSLCVGNEWGFWHGKWHYRRWAVLCKENENAAV